MALFFLSYARADSNVYFTKFVEQLRIAVQARVGGTLADTGFVDTSQVQVGADWSAELTRALQSCRVFVPVFSNDFFRSEFCGREWAMFRRRSEAAPDAHGPAATSRIVPVLWGSPAVFEGVPAVCSALQYTHGLHGEQYAKSGLGQMVRVPKLYDGEWENVVERIADRIVEVSKQPELPTPDALADVLEIDPDFPRAALTESEPTGPEFAQFVFAVGRRSELEGLQDVNKNQIPVPLDSYFDEYWKWRPYPPSPAKFQQIVQRVSEDVGLTGVAIPLDDQLPARLQQSSENDAIFALVVDAWSVLLSPYREFLTSYARAAATSARRAACTILVWNPSDQTAADHRQELDGQIGEIFGPLLDARGRVLLNPSATDLVVAQSAEQLRAQLRESLQTAKIRALNDARSKRPVGVGGPRPILSAVASDR